MQRVMCDLCGRAIPPHFHYIVRIDVFADPSLPPMSTEELEKTDFEEMAKDLIEQMSQMSAEELQDQVHRRFEFRLCRLCQMAFLANPLGKPRLRTIAGN